jgi:aminoglycoside 6'-N-acetyltransferase
LIEKPTRFPVRIEGERIYLRSYQPGDGSWLYEVSQKNREHLQRYESDNFLMTINSEEQAESEVCEIEKSYGEGDYYFLPVFLQSTDQFAAQIYIGRTNLDLPEYVVGFIADVDHEGQGYITEALKAVLDCIFDHLGAHRVFLECDDTNNRSWAVAERCGFIREGHLRENKYHPDSTISGTYIYGLLRNDYES